MRDGTREREPIDGLPELRSLPARASASQRFYWPAKRCPTVPTIEMPFPLCCPRDGVQGLGPTWPRRAARTSTYVICVSTAARPTIEEKMEGRESALKESHPSTPVVHALRRVKFCLVVYTCAP